jgi:hypothetical protein
MKFEYRVSALSIKRPLNNDGYGEQSEEQPLLVGVINQEFSFGGFLVDDTFHTQPFGCIP